MMMERDRMEVKCQRMEDRQNEIIKQVGQMQKIQKHILQRLDAIED